MNIRTALVVVSCALSVIIGLVVARGGQANAGPGGGASSNRKPLIGLSLDTLKEARWEADKNLFVARCNARIASAVLDRIEQLLRSRTGKLASR